MADGTWIVIEGLTYLPLWLFGFGYDSVYKTNVPFSGPCGDYEGAARKEEYEETQRAVYSGYKNTMTSKLRLYSCQMISLPFLVQFERDEVMLVCYD